MSASGIEKKIVVDEKGNPLEVIIPWEVFLRVSRELEGLDPDELTPEIEEALDEARRDRAEGNKEAFISLEKLQAEFAEADAKN